MDHFVVCTHCARHVKASDGACPFCKTKRARVIVGAALAIASAAAIAACNRDSGVVLYGAPPLLAGDSGTTVTLIPPPDAGDAGK
jgi:hypothetical protein